METVSSDITYKSGNENISARLAVPAEKGNYPGIVLVHEIFGLDDHTKDVAGRIAAEGYSVIAPHLFSSERFAVPLSTENIAAAMRFMMSIPPEKHRDEAYREAEMAKLGAEDRAAVTEVNRILFENRPVDTFTEYLSSAVDYLNSNTDTGGKIGSVGFCFGGGMSISLACTGKTDASIIFYGENPSPIDKVANVKGAVMGLYGGEDARINSKIHELVAALTANKRPFTIRVFPGARHAFFNDTRPMYDEKAARESWAMVKEFFRDNLKGK